MPWPFSVPASSRHRLAEPFARDPLTGAGVTLIDVAEPPVFESAGGGLVSTAAEPFYGLTDCTVHLRKK